MTAQGFAVACRHCKRVIRVLDQRDDAEAERIASAHRITECTAIESKPALTVFSTVGQA